MKIILEGKTTITKLPKIIKEVTDNIKEKAGIKDAPVKIDRAEITLVVMLNGEPQYVTVNHEGLPELFTVAVKLDEKGNIEKSVDNEAISFIDEYSRAVAKGEEKEYPVIAPAFEDADLELVHTNNGGDIIETIYKQISTGHTVVRYHKNGDLIGELSFETDPENVINS